MKTETLKELQVVANDLVQRIATIIDTTRVAEFKNIVDKTFALEGTNAVVARVDTNGAKKTKAPTANGKRGRPASKDYEGLLPGLAVMLIRAGENGLEPGAMGKVFHMTLGQRQAFVRLATTRGVLRSTGAKRGTRYFPGPGAKARAKEAS